MVRQTETIVDPEVESDMQEVNLEKETSPEIEVDHEHGVKTLEEEDTEEIIGINPIKIHLQRDHFSVVNKILIQQICL